MKRIARVVVSSQDRGRRAPGRRGRKRESGNTWEGERRRGVCSGGKGTRSEETWTRGDVRSEERRRVERRRDPREGYGILILPSGTAATDSQLSGTGRSARKRWSSKWQGGEEEEEQEQDKDEEDAEKDAVHEQGGTGA